MNKYNEIFNGLDADCFVDDMVSNFEKVNTSVFSSPDKAVEYVAVKIIDRIKNHQQDKKFILGLSTGTTPITLFKELTKLYTEGKADFANVEICVSDEYYPVEDIHKQRNCPIKEFVKTVNIEEQNVHYPHFNGGNLVEFCRNFDNIFRKADLVILGIGEQGQVGFNEPSIFAKSKTRLTKLSYKSRKRQSEKFDSLAATPRNAITVGIDTILATKEIILMAWGESKASVINELVEKEPLEGFPASLLQTHSRIEVVIDDLAASSLTRKQQPWLIAQCKWSQKLIRKAVIWLCEVVGKPVLKLTYEDYVEHSLDQLLESTGKSFDTINIEVFNSLQRTITGWPGGKPNADDSTRPVSSNPYPKGVVIFSPHPDDDVISMGGTFHRLVQQGHDVHIAYQTSGNVAVADDVVLQNIDTAYQLGYLDQFNEVRSLISNPAGNSRLILDMKGAIRRAEARAACRTLGLDADRNAHFLNLPFYETGGVKKGELTQADVDIVVKFLREIKPNQIYAAGDLYDPHGTHKICMDIIMCAIEIVKRDNDEWMKNCTIWLYRGAWKEWDLGLVDMAVPLSPSDVVLKRHAIYRHLSQKDIVPFPGDDTREFWQRAEDRTQMTAKHYCDMGMAQYQAIEVFVKLL